MPIKIHLEQAQDVDSLQSQMIELRGMIHLVARIMEAEWVDEGLDLSTAERNGACTLLRAIADGLEDLSGEIDWKQPNATLELIKVEK